MDLKKIGLFAGGVLFGTAGIKALSSKDAKKAYTQTTAAALRVKDSVMNTVTAVRENADDIYAGAQAINEQRAGEECCAVIEDASEEAEETCDSAEGSCEEAAEECSEKAEGSEAE
ncbi:MAG: DUF6110 family protein [Clostridia bacterium]|nr:DUF6110 family protein [Clostridia bacterium]